MLIKIMTKIFLLSSILFFTSCANKNGISLKHYSECKEYYDLQGYYHKKCGEDDIISYKRMGEEVRNATKKVERYFTNEKEPVKGNVW